MNEEKDFRILYSLVALGVLVVSAITAYFHSMLALPLAVVGLIFIPFILVQDKEKYAGRKGNVLYHTCNYNNCFHMDLHSYEVI